MQKRACRRFGSIQRHYRSLIKRGYAGAAAAVGVVERSAAARRLSMTRGSARLVRFAGTR